MGKRGPKRDPKSLESYARHAGISAVGARKNLTRAGVDYSKPFDFAEADKKVAASRHPSRDKVRRKLRPDEGLSYSEWDTRHKAAKAVQEERKLAELEGSLVRRDAVAKAMFVTGRRIRDGLENLSARLSGILAAETNQTKIFETLTREIQITLEALCK